MIELIHVVTEGRATAISKEPDRTINAITGISPTGAYCDRTYTKEAITQAIDQAESCRTSGTCRASISSTRRHYLSLYMSLN